MIEENVVSAAGTTFRAGSTTSAASSGRSGKRPVQRDTLYRRVRDDF